MENGDEEVASRREYFVEGRYEVDGGLGFDSASIWEDCLGKKAWRVQMRGGVPLQDFNVEMNGGGESKGEVTSVLVLSFVGGVRCWRCMRRNAVAGQQSVEGEEVV